jgi:hypothetical protein
MHSKLSNIVRGASGLLLVALAAGCTTVTTPELDADHGNAVRAIKAAQTVNPMAPAGNAAVIGIDGKAAVNAQERYQDSFKAPPATFNVLGIGGNLSTSSGQ